MSVNVTLNGVSYSIAEPGDDGWGQDFTDYFVAQATGLLQKAGGTFTLTAEVDFGATYGLKSAYFKSRAANPSTAGVVRLGNTESISWRNAANGANLALTVGVDNLLAFNGTAIQPAGNYITALTGNVTASGPGSVVATIAAGVIVNSMVSGSAAIAYSKLNLATSIVNGDISGSAAIAYSKLNLTGGIVNADVSGSAAIAYSKLNLATSIVNADISASAAIAYSKLNLSLGIVNGDISASAAIGLSKLAAVTASRALVSDGSGFVSAATTTATEIGYVNGVTSAIQTQLDAKQARSTLTTKGDLYVATASATVARQGVGADGTVLTADSGQTNGIRWVAPSAVSTYAITSKTAAYTITSSDYTILANASGGLFALDLPVASSNTGRVFVIKRTDSTLTTYVQINPNGAELIDGVGNIRLYTQYESVTLQSDGTNWAILDHRCDTNWTTFTPTGSWVANTTYAGRYRRIGDSIEIQATLTLAGAPTSANLTITLPSGVTIETNKLTSTNISNLTLGTGSVLDNGVGYLGPVLVGYATSSTVAILTTRTDSTYGSQFEVNQAIPMTFVSGDMVHVQFRVPVSGWFA